MPYFPEIVVLCGSTRFFDAFQEANYRLQSEIEYAMRTGVPVDYLEAIEAESA